jgi:hypothetical protein
MDHVKPSIPEREIENWEVMLASIGPWFNLGHGVPPIAYIRAFALVASKEGLTVAEYAERAGIAPTVMTRNLLDLGEVNRQREAGLGLIVQERDPFDLRKHRARLTAKGRKLSHDLDLAYSRIRGRK